MSENKEEIRKLIMGTVDLETWREKALWEEIKRQRDIIERLDKHLQNIEEMAFRHEIDEIEDEAHKARDMLKLTEE